MHQQTSLQKALKLLNLLNQNKTHKVASLVNNPQIIIYLQITTNQQAYLVLKAHNQINPQRRHKIQNKHNKFHQTKVFLTYLNKIKMQGQTTHLSLV